VIDLLPAPNERPAIKGHLDDAAGSEGERHASMKSRSRRSRSRLPPTRLSER